jgi:hypothetical protein
MPFSRPYGPAMTTRKLIATAAVALTAAGAAAATGSAQSAPSSLHFVLSNQTHVGFAPRHAPRQGDRVGFGERVSGADSGRSRALCTVIGRDVMCSFELQLHNGTITAQGILPQQSRQTPVAVTGGTRAYDGARGTVLVTDVNQRTTNLDLSLRP